MFQTEKIPAFLQGVKFAGKDGLEFTVYINGVTHELVSEVADWMADIMFRRGNDGKWQPVKGLPSGELDDPKVPVQMMGLYPVAEEEHENLGAMLPSASVYGFKTLRLFDDKPDLTLAFNVRVERNKLSLELGDRYFKKKEGLFLSFAPMKTELPMDHPGDTVDGNALCEECNLVASVIETGGERRAWCGDHLRLAGGEVKELHLDRKETPQQAKERVEREAAVKQKELSEMRGQLNGDLNGQPVGEPENDMEGLAAEAAAINEAAAEKSRNRRKRAVN